MFIGILEMDMNVSHKVQNSKLVNNFFFISIVIFTRSLIILEISKIIFRHYFGN